ncbi:MAG TPA: hypothetical protein VIG88_13950, partial [Lysobacter sp.]
ATAPVLAGGQVAIDRRAPVAPGALAGGGTTVYEIHVHAGAGAAGQDIAQQVRRELEKIENERRASRRSRLADDEN